MHFENTFRRPVSVLRVQAVIVGFYTALFVGVGWWRRRELVGPWAVVLAVALGLFLFRVALRIILESRSPERIDLADNIELVVNGRRFVGRTEDVGLRASILGFVAGKRGLVLSLGGVGSFFIPKEPSAFEGLAEAIADRKV